MDTPKTPPEPQVEDVSDRFELARSARMFRSEAGYLVKVETERLASDDHGSIHFRLTGSVCGDDGAPELVNGTAFTGAPHVVSVKSESRVDLAAELIAAQALIVRRMETAAIHQAQAKALLGEPASGVTA